MKIWQKILFGFLLIFVLISLSGVPISLYYGRIVEAFQTVIHRDLVAIETVGELERITLEMTSLLQHHYSTGSQASLERFQEEKRRWLFLKEQFADGLDPERFRTRLLLKRIENATLEWAAAVEGMPPGGHKEIDPLVGFGAIRSLYRALLNEERDRLAQSYAYSVKTVEQGEDLALALRAVALGLGLLVCLLVIRSVKRPLDRLVSATSAVAAGRFDPVPATSKDELGQLTRSFNEMSQSLKERTAALEEQRRLAVQANALKTEFLANTSHELRTPLNTIMGYSQLILDGLARSRDEEKTYLGTIQQSSRRLLALINDVLDISRIEAGQMQLELGPVPVREVFDVVRKDMQFPAQEKGLRLVVANPGEDLWIHGHAGRLSQVLANVTGNAIKFTDTGTVSLEVKRDGDDGLIRFVVRDTGIGIPVEKQGRLFEKFVQADGSVTRHHSGTGLGLALSRTLLELMEGRIELFSEGEGKGMAVTITMKRHSRDEVCVR